MIKMESPWDCLCVRLCYVYQGELGRCHLGFLWHFQGSLRRIEGPGLHPPSHSWM